MLPFFKSVIQKSAQKCKNNKLLSISAGVGLVAGGLYLYRNNLEKKNKENIQGKHVFITGAASGIGKKMAIQFAKLGANVSLIDINLTSLVEVEKALNDQGCKAFGIQSDLTKEDDISRAVMRAKEQFGSIDILINNAGIVSGKKIDEVTNKSIDLTFQVNAIAPIKLTKLVLPDMIQQNSGHIVTIASLAGIVGTSGLVDYTASKFAAVGFNESLRLELAKSKSNVKTTVICPFFINTGMFDGVKSKIIPILEEDDAVENIMQAIILQKKMYILPKILDYALFFKAICPIALTDKIMGILGLNSCMDEFVGRQSRL